MKLLVIDGNSILNRAFYGIKLLSTKDGLYTNAIYGFLATFLKLREETEPDGVAMAFDVREPTFRHKAYDGYKANRKGMPEELAAQLPILKELLGGLGYKIVESPGFEADDILGTLAERCRESGNPCVIATGDKDSLQLARDGVTVRITATKMGRPEVTVYDEEKIREVYGVTPAQMIEIKALQGDSSDNIPGVAGIGPKGAGDLIQKYGSLDAIYENLDTLEIKEGMREKLRKDKENAYLSRMLGTIRTDAPVEENLEAYRPGKGDRAAAAKLMAKLEMFSMIDKFGLSAADAAVETDSPAEPGNPVPVRETDAEEFSALCRETGRMDFLCETEQGKAARLWLNAAGEIRLLEMYAERDGEGNPLLSSRIPLEALRTVFADPALPKRTHDIKSAANALAALDIKIEGAAFDSMLAAYLLNPSGSGYEPVRLATEYCLGIPPIEGEDPPETARQTAVLPELFDRLAEKLERSGATSLLRDIELPLALVLSKMERKGFAVDEKGIATFGRTLEARADEIQEEIYRLVGYSFNINSPKQLGEALFVKLGLPTGKKTKTGYSTNAEVLEGLQYAHPAVELILEYRGLVKLKSTYCDGLVREVASDGRIHTSFNQVETRTGRISSTEPNLQNIPVRTELGREMRKFFHAREGFLLVDADYSQIELRVLAHMARDKNMIAAFRENADIHRITASQVFNMPFEAVTPLMRSRAKAVNFGIVYGIGAFSLSKDIGVTRREADQYIQDYLAHYSGVDAFMKQCVSLAKENGYAQTLFGRRRYLPELAVSNRNIRAFGERVAMNMPIQGTAADIIKIAMIRVQERFKKEEMRTRLILQVHDELIAEAPEEEALRAAMLLQEEMENAVELSVKMVADATIGRTWYDAKIG